TVIDQWRRKRLEVPIDDEHHFTSRPNLEEKIDRQRVLRRLGHAISRLATRDREIVEMFYLKELSVPAIADRFKLSQSAVKMILLRSRRTLHRLLSITTVR